MLRTPYKLDGGMEKNGRIDQGETKNGGDEYGGPDKNGCSGWWTSAVPQFCYCTVQVIGQYRCALVSGTLYSGEMHLGLGRLGASCLSDGYYLHRQ